MANNDRRRGQEIIADWTAEDFESAIQWSEKSLSDASPAESITLKVQILDYSDQLERMAA